MSDQGQARKRHDQLIAGALSGAGTTSILHPLDLAKVRFQVDPTGAHQNRPFMHTFRYLGEIARTEGFRSGLYQGFTANFIANMTAWGLYFAIYERLKASKLITEYFGPYLGYFGASGLAGATTLCLINPLWVVKTRMCLSREYSSVPQALLRIGREEGVRGLYRGLLPGFFGVSHGAIQFTVYESFKRQCDKLHIPQNNLTYLVMSTSSKLVAMSLTYPYQVVRSRLQLLSMPGKGTSTTELRFLTIVRAIYKLEGPRGFYKGIVPSAIRVLPGTSLTFLIYENSIKWLRAP